MVRMGYGNIDSATGAAIVENLRNRGITASYFDETYDDTDEEDGEIVTERGILCRQADLQVARRVTEEHLR